MMVDRLSTSIEELDEILCGGLLRHSVNVLMGAPGTGKTILAEQIAFFHGSRGERVLYLTTFSEPLEKFVLHGRAYEFFDPDMVGRSVFYEDLGLLVNESSGLSTLVETVTEMTAQHKPRVLIIDSFKALNRPGLHPEDRRQIVFELATVLASLDCTTILVGEYAPESLTELPEFAIADGIIQLSKVHSGMREQRFLRVEKLRGSDSLEGMHAFGIHADGLHVYPRLRTPANFPDYSPSLERAKSGVPRLDTMLDGGFLRGSTSLVAGPTGVGKTALALRFAITGALAGEKTLYLGFQENPVQFRATLRNFGWDDEALLSSGNMEHMYRSPVEMQIDSVVVELFQRVRQQKIRRLVIDALGDLRHRSYDPQRLIEYLYSLTQWFAVEEVTTLITVEVPTALLLQQVTGDEVSNMSDNILTLRFKADREMQRWIRILKTRNSGHDPVERRFEISSSGMEIDTQPQES
ncbi:MAG: ATPase domain-containing protein [Thermoanaerobaculia bacterium]